MLIRKNFVFYWKEEGGVCAEPDVMQEGSR